MSLPDDLTTFTLSFGPYIDAKGDPVLAGVTGSLRPDRKLVHVATGRQILESPIRVQVDDFGVASVSPLPHCDNDGVGGPFLYKMVWDLPPGAPSPGNLQFSVLESDGATIDFDLLVASETVPGVSVPSALSVAGLTGAVTAPDLVDALDVELRAAFGALQKVAATVTASGALVVAKHNPVNATSGAKTMTLPTGQPEGTQVSVEKTDASANAVSITGSIRGVGSSTITLPWQSEALLLRADSAGSWWPVSGHKTKASLDAAFGARRSPALAKLDARLSARQTTPVRLAFTGSSTTQGTGASDGDHRWVDTFVGMLQVAFPSGGIESRVVSSTSAVFGTLTGAPGVHGYNAAEGGKTSWDWLTPTEQANVAAIDPAAVFHMIGANDFTGGGVTVADYKANVLAAVNTIKAAATGPLVQVLLHTFRPPLGGIYPWADFGQALREIAAADPDNVVFVDISDAYERVAHAGADLVDVISSDNIHQTNAGHRFMATLIARELGYPIVPVPGRVLVSDSFDRADGAVGTADTGQTWTAFTGTWTISSGKLAMTVGGTTSIDAGSPDVDMTCTVVPDGQTIGVIFRALDDSNRLGVFLTSADGIALFRHNAGAITVLATGAIPVANLVTGRSYRLRVVAIRERITVWVNSALILSYTLSGADQTTYGARTLVGVRCGTLGANSRWDDFLVKTVTA